MNICLKELTDHSVVLMSEYGQSICTFHSMSEALQACNAWHRANSDIIFEAVDGKDMTQEDAAA